MGHTAEAEPAQSAVRRKLLSDRVAGRTVDVLIDGVGTVTVRALSRYEMIVAGKHGAGDDLRQERFILSAAMLSPKLTEDEVEQWQKCSPPGEINAVASAINELSGIGQGASKSDVPEV
jgi:hypothetical protein